MANELTISYPYEKIYCVIDLENVSYEDFVERFTLLETDSLNDLETVEGFNPLEHYDLEPTSVGDMMTTLLYNGPEDCPGGNCDNYYDIYLNFSSPQEIMLFSLSAETFDCLESLIADN